MIGILFRWLALTVAITIAAYLLEGIRVDGFISAFFAAAILSIFNALFRPIALVITLPINVLTLGLFTFVINALMLKMASGVIPGFNVQGFWTAIFGSMIISLISWLLNSFISDQGSVSFIKVQRHDLDRRIDGIAGDDETIDLKKKGNNRWD